MRHRRLDGAGGGVDPGDPNVTVMWTWRNGLGGPVAYNAVGMYFWCGAADVGNSGLTPYLYRDQNNDGRCPGHEGEARPAVERTGGCIRWIARS